MAIAVDTKQTRQRLDNHPRLKRKATKPAPLIDPIAALMYRDETQYHRALFRDFVKFCRVAGAWVISPPFDRRCRVLVPNDSPLLERLKQLPRYPVAILPGSSHRLQGGRFIPVTEVQVTLWRA
jgi:hypothetical protein